MPTTFLLAHSDIFGSDIYILYGHFIPMDILPYGHFLIHQICMDISLLWTICHMVFLHIDPPYYCCFLHTKKDSEGGSIHRINESFLLKPSLGLTQ